MDYRTVEKALDLALQQESQKHYVTFTSVNNRAYRCKVSKCPNNAYAKGMCNAHYIRARKGMSLDAPLQCRNKGEVCLVCGDPTNTNSGWNRCKQCYCKTRRDLLKKVLIETLGGRCKSCRRKFPPCVFDFHHKHNKTQDISTMLINNSTTQIAKEAVKCILLCANCHRKETHG